jgi:hypothetical protein
MRTLSKRKSVPYGRLIAPVVLILFAVGWYQFSVVYIQRANDQLVANDDLSVYVPVQQVHGYLAALLDATYVVVALGALVLAYNALRYLRRRTAVESAAGPASG